MDRDNYRLTAAVQKDGICSEKCFFVCIVNGNANFSARRQCLYRLNYQATSSSIWNLFVRVCFSKKYQTDKNLLDQNSSSKHPHNAILSAQHLNPVSRATSKLLIKIAAPDWFLKISIDLLLLLLFFLFFFFLPITVLHSLIIAFPRFWTRFTVTYFSVSSWRSTALHYGRPPYILDFYQIYFLASLPPHKPHIL